ncbi:sensor histidine kinase [Aquibacillus sp. 3ASR75-11]|uniref:histidine kinase n=1 Tax=Terrihalobacillus insolitus TaxID=2950438 RepID=A0A9X3WVD9_9BACI|nr:sensor histidine kinase [Terrihalobacillus insolitus]MDC3414034.1 sensor histidine kinase [Terrihalobacillus insolitus]MDC3424124.1 sensor histidine kinase [Terrihalobacillus insolitus]
MQNWYHIIPKNTGLSAYVWIIFCILPFYFIIRSSSSLEIVFGILMILLFFGSYRLSFISKGWSVYVWVIIEMTISIVMTLLFGYVYFALFLAFFIGKIQNKIGFSILYGIHLLSTIGAITIVFMKENALIYSQLPFIVISIIGVLLLPFTMYNRIKREELEVQLEHANKKISRLIIMEERQRIARDLHDTLGQKLSLIGLKSDLAGKLVDKKPDAAKAEINDIHQTARMALKEVREMVSDMRGIKLKEEMIHVRQMLKAANIELRIDGNPEFTDTPLLVENVLSMCLKEAVTNIVKHSQATSCNVWIKQVPNELCIKVQDNGKGITEEMNSTQGHGIEGMRERLEFVNGSLEIESGNGTTLTIRVPNVIQQTNKGAKV